MPDEAMPGWLRPLYRTTLGDAAVAAVVGEAGDETDVESFECRPPLNNGALELPARRCT